MSAKSEAPGLQIRRNGDGTSRAYWHAPTYIKKLGYQPTQVRLDGQLPEVQWAAECRRLHEAMLVWAAARKESRCYDGTLASLVAWYQVEQDSPYHGLRRNTARSYRVAIKPLVSAKGNQLIADVTGAKVRRWFDELQEGGRMTSSAAMSIRVFKAILAFGSSHRDEACTKLRNELRDVRFKVGEQRESQFTYEQLVDFREAAIAAERPSMALAATLQFELGMRQKDVIGEWVEAPGTDGIRDSNGLRWVNGLTGMLFDDAGNIRKRTTKTGTRVEHQLDNYPELAALVRPALERDRGGPLVISEITRRPYKVSAFRHCFRRIAREAMIPDDVWSMDARAGAVTESYEAGATTEEAMALAGHTQAKTSRRYLRSVARQSSSAARKRLQARGGSE